MNSLRLGFFHICCIFCPVLLLTAQEKANNPVPVTEAKESWKLAQENTTTVDMISVPEGFAVDLVRSANEGEGSWITLEFDDKNHLYVAKEDKGIVRYNLDSNGHLINSTVVEAELEQCRGLLWAYDSLYVNSNNPMPPPMEKKELADGLFRLKDEDGDGKFESRVKLLETTQGSPGHGRNQLRLGPDGMIYFMSGYDVFLTDKVEKNSPLKDFKEDQLIPNPWDEEWFNKHAMAPGGHLCRMNKEGTTFELIAGGFRNPVDIAFNREGEIFTYDADMEWDAALAWYKPTRILHVVSGADYGWRRATGKFPAYYEDSLPAAVDVGLGSPTGLEFGYKSSYPDEWKDVLFTADWTYGRILAVRLEERGGTYGGTFETFASGRPMNVVDMTFGPDGNLYFVTGGMKTKSGIYRIRWVGEKEEAPAKAVTPNNSELRNLRRQLEKYHVAQDEQGTKLALQNIDHSDDFVRHAARIALENQVPDEWVGMALSSKSPAALVALARGKRILQDGKLVKKLNAIDLEKVSEKKLLGYLRAYQLEFIRNEKPTGKNLQNAIKNLESRFPHSDTRVNHELCELLVYLEAPGVLQKISKMIDGAKNTEDLSQYLVFSRYLKSGWSLETKRTFLKGVQRLESFPGGKFHPKVVKYLRDEMLATLSEPEKMALSKWLEPYVPPKEEVPPVTFVKNWTLEDFSGYFGAPLHGRDFEKGRVAYTKANCILCHKMAGNQASVKGVAGPDLSNVGGRFGVKDLLVSIIDPSRAINDKYRNPAAPNLSTMPPALINVLEKEEVIDLLAYLQSGGNKKDAVYSSAPPAKPKKAVAKIEKAASIEKLLTPKDEIEVKGIEISPHLFDRMSAANKGDRERFFNDLNNVLKIHPGAKFVLIGHADDSKYSTTNYDISLNRAKFTAQNMIYRGIPKDAISYRAMGDKDPSSSGNRRVEVLVKLEK